MIRIYIKFYQRFKTFDKIWQRTLLLCSLCSLRRTWCKPFLDSFSSMSIVRPALIRNIMRNYYKIEKKKKVAEKKAFKKEIKKLSQAEWVSSLWLSLVLPLSSLSSHSPSPHPPPPCAASRLASLLDHLPMSVSSPFIGGPNDIFVTELTNQVRHPSPSTYLDRPR